jgi:hypothetical protein
MSSVVDIILFIIPRAKFFYNTRVLREKDESQASGKWSVERVTCKIMRKYYVQNRKDPIGTYDFSPLKKLLKSMLRRWMLRIKMYMGKGMIKT